MARRIVLAQASHGLREGMELSDTAAAASGQLHDDLAANAMGFTDPGHLELHGFL